MSLQFHDPYYHATLFPSEPRTKNYSYDEDQNGRYLIRYDDATDNNIEADYFFVHFSLPWEDPFIDGKPIWKENSLMITSICRVR